jgi:hypothetical protein
MFTERKYMLGEHKTRVMSVKSCDLALKINVDQLPGLLSKEMMREIGEGNRIQIL